MAVQPHVLNWLYSVLTSEYHDVNRTYNDVAQALAQFSTLSPRTDVHTFPNGASALLLHLSGTVPAVFRGAIYRYPISLWVPHAYPREPPLVYVTPTENMLVRPGQHVDPQGQVYHPYLVGWATFWDKSSIVDFLTILRDVFAKEPPVISRSQPPRPPFTATASPPPPLAPPPIPPLPHELASTPRSPPPLPLRPSSTASGLAAPPPPPKGNSASPPKGNSGVAAVRATSTPTPPPPPVPPHPHFAASSASAATTTYTSAPPAIPPHPTAVHPPSASTPAPASPALAGAPPVPGRPPYQQSPLSQTPLSPGPLPQPALLANAYRHPVPLPPARVASASFGALPNSAPSYYPPQHAYSAHQQPPPFSYQQQQQPPQQTQQQQQQHFAYGPPPPVQQPQARPKQPPPPDLMDEPPIGAASATAAVASTAAATTAATTASSSQPPPPPPPPVPPNPEKNALLHRLAVVLADRRQHSRAQNEASLAGLQAQRVAMAAAAARLQQEMSALAQLSALLTSNTGILHETLHSADAVIAECSGGGGSNNSGNTNSSHARPPAIDDLLVGPTVVANQLYDLVAEERALADAVFMLGRAVEHGRVSPAIFAKMTRSLAREWFLKKALVRKIGRGMGLAAAG